MEIGVKMEDDGSNNYPIEEYPEDLQSLIYDFEDFSIDLICRIWDDQDSNALACRDILRALPSDFESEPQWLQETRLQQEAIERNTSLIDKTSYRDILLTPAQNSSDDNAGPHMLKLSSGNKTPWKPKIVVTKDVPPPSSLKNVAPEEDDEDERELQWMICCDGQRDAVKSIGGAKRKAHISKLFIRQPERDQRLKRAATSMK